MTRIVYKELAQKVDQWHKAQIRSTSEDICAVFNSINENGRNHDNEKFYINCLVKPMIHIMYPI
jgi:hypothetical protein